MAREQKQYDDDDGRVICNMDVEGMPWHNKRARRQASAVQAVPQGEQLTDAEARQYTFHAVLAGLLIVGVFALTWVLVILFCINVWFR